MSRALAVIGANFGDEGKGLVVDHLCAARGAGMVVRFNGGAQAGHTVVEPSGRRHVFAHVGSGALCGVPTFLSRYFILNPILLLEELDDLAAVDVRPVICADPRCLVTTFADMWINQEIERARGDGRHGSVGVGINETVVRSEDHDLRITAEDLWAGRDLRPRLRAICGRHAWSRCGSAIPDPEPMIENFVRDCARFADAVRPSSMWAIRGEDLIFEGAQGLLLDQNRREFFPHVTRSSTGMRNVMALCAEAAITTVEAHYVSRTYLTRHGAGPLPGEVHGLSFPDDTNVDHPYQGRLRFAHLDPERLVGRVMVDWAGHVVGAVPPRIVLTHCDQLAPSPEMMATAALLVSGPTRVDVEEREPCETC